MSERAESDRSGAPERGAAGSRTARRYDASGRRQQARRNRAAVLGEARRRFLADGYAATTLREIAEGAGVSVETVYKAFGSKAGVLKAVFDVSVAGDDEQVPIAERNFIAAIVAEPDARRKIERYTEHLAVTMPRVVPVQLLARDAAAADADAASVWHQMRAETLTAMAMFAADLARTGALTVSVDDARDVLWAFHSPEWFELLVLERGWSAARYGAFLAGSIAAAVLTP